MGLKKSGVDMDKPGLYDLLTEIKSVTLKGDYNNKTVWLNDKVLSPEYSRKIYMHTADGFDWSNTGEGAAQLALAVLLELSNEKKVSMILHHVFKNECISVLPKSDFEVNINMGEWFSKHIGKVAWLQNAS